MSICNIMKTIYYSSIDYKVIYDSRLSWKASGILIYLLSKPNDWEVRFRDIVEKSECDGEIAVRNAMKELIKFGYAKLMRGRYLNKNNEKKLGSFYEIYESPC